MLQPRKRKFTLKITPKGLLLCVIILLTFTQNLDYVKGEDERNGSIKEKIRRGERVIRHGDVNIVVLDDLDRRKITPSVGLLSTTARTFIQEGTTTEYATHIYGTTVGDKYAHIVSTGSKIFYDNVRPSKEKFDSVVTIPPLEGLIFPATEENIIIIPTRVLKEKPASAEKLIVLPNKEDVSHKNIDSLKANIPSVSEKVPVTVNKSPNTEDKGRNSNFITIRKEISIKPAKVKLKNELPTFTVKQDSAEIETRVESFSPQVEDNSIRSAKNVFHKPVAKTPELTTTTYFGFADFVTTAGNTVIIFTPKTQRPNYEGAVTSIPGAATLSGANNIPLSTATYSIPTTNAPITTESSEEEVTESSKNDYETTTVKEIKTETEPPQSHESEVEHSHGKSVQHPHESEAQQSHEVEIETTTADAPETTTESMNDAITTENIIASTNVENLVNNDVPFIENNDNLEPSFSRDINPTSATDVYKTLTYVTTFYLKSQNGQTGTSISSNTVVVPHSTEKITTEADTEVTTQSGTTEMDEDTTTEKLIEDITTTERTTEKILIKEKPEEPLTTTPEPITTTPEPDEDNVEVELIFKTLYTTYTYLTTYFEKSTTKVKSREEVVTSVVTSTLDSAFLQLATDPAVAGLFSSNGQGPKREGKVLPNNLGVGRPTASIRKDEIASSNLDSDNEITKPTPALEHHQARSHIKTKYTTYTSLSRMVKDDKTIVMNNNTGVYTNVINPTASQQIKPSISNELPSDVKEKIPLKPIALKHTPVNSYKTTIKRIKPTSTELVNDVQETKKEAKNDTEKLHNSIVSGEMLNSVIISAPLTNDVSLVSTKKSTEQTPKKVYLDNDNDDDQLSQESNTEETHPNPSLISLQTTFTTYTYFTTLYKGTSSEVVSRLETVTNVNTELIKPSAATETVQNEEAGAPVTYYTTYTYWTTFYKDGSTMIKSRQETVSNVAQSTISPTSTQEVKKEIEPTKEPMNEPVTYYTTFTYFTTSYIGNSSVVNSHLETVTNIVDATKAPELSDEKILQTSDGPILKATGLLSSALETRVNDNVTTVFTTNTYGTYVDGVYSQVLESTSSIVTSPISESMKPPPEDLKPTGLVSINEGEIIDAFNISTTLYTTKVIGTYIEQLYAQVIESTSSVKVNTEKLSNLINPSTVVLKDKIYQTGVLQLTQGSLIKDKTTTFYETKVVGKIVDEQYSSVTETSSSIYVEIIPTKTSEDIKATATADLSAAPPTLTSTSPSPAVIESSLNDNSNENDSDEDKDKSDSKRKSFTPVIRPFASRSRPSFLPKKKSSESLGAATITRGIIPTIVAIPAVKSTEPRIFGSANRNRFASSKKSSVANSPVSEVRSTAPSSRRFSKAKSTASSYLPSSSQFVRSSSAKAFSPSSATPNYKRGSYRPTSTRSVDYLSSSPGGSRFRIRPTASGRIASFTPSTTPKLEEIESNEFGFTEQALSSSDEEVIETLPPATTESSRRNNPLLRFRKPGTGASVPRSTSPPSTTVRSTTQRKNIGRKVNNDNKITTTKAPSTTRSYKPRTPSSINNHLRPRPANSLLPTKPPLKKVELENESDEVDESKLEQTDSFEEVTESLDILNGNSIVERSSRKAPSVSIKPFPNRRGRIKRQSEFGYKYENVRGQSSSRYRRPTQNSFPDYLYYDDLEYTTEDISARSVSNRNNFKSRNTQQLQQPYQQYQQSYQQPLQYQQTYQSTTPAQIYQSPKIRPSSAITSSNRAQFTLREKTQTTTAIPSRSNRRTTAAPSHRKLTEPKRSSSRLRSYTTTTELSLYRNNRKPSTNRRTTSRSRYKDNDLNVNTYSPTFDGTITVTHKIPTEVTIPVFNGKFTEYKNVVTAKPSLQTLGPHQYSTVTGKNGATTLQLVNEVTETLLNGVTEVTRFVIQEFPTTSVTFTPTTIRGRKTSFSHVIPSTVYEIKPEISTIAPQLNANAPLANLLLSQLLLGNLGIQPTINPLLGLNQAAATPVTEFKTKTTTYVTTITHSTSTIIPVTFRGKEIKTTVIDSSTQVITATEYITETMVISPTQTAPPNQLNTLLLPALLQQAQLLNQPQPTTSSPIDENIAENLQLIQDSPSPSKVIKNGLNLDNEKDEDFLQKEPRKKQKPIEPAETSVVTLYLSGRRPGEFSTVLSTVVLDDKSATLRKRSADPSYDVKPSALPSLSSSFDYDDYFDEIIKSGINDISSSEVDHETQSLESIVGNFGSRLPSDKVPQQETKTNHFLLKTSTESAPFRWNSNLTRGSKIVKHQADQEQSPQSDFNWSQTFNLGRKLLSVDDDALPLEDTPSVNATFQISADNKSSSVEDEGRGRYNLATKVMSNGVEVIVALDKSTLPGSPQLLRVLPTSNIRPITLTPSTVTDHMIMMLPHGLQDTSNSLVTKTYVTTYTYLTTLLQEGHTTTSSKEKVVSNVLTENVNVTPTNSPNADARVTLSSSPIMATKVLQTTYTMESTVIDGNTPHVVTSQQTVTNTITAPGSQFAHLLQPSEPNYVESNSVSSKEVINEDYTIKPTEKLNTEMHLKNSDKNQIEVKPTSLQAADVTKTYFVTYTYFSTLLENGTTVIKSNIATSSDVVTEKVYMPLKRTKHPVIKETQTSITSTETEKPISIYATKTYLTTFTYFTTLLQEKGGKSPQTVIRSRTKVMQNLVTETLNTNLLNSDYLSNLKHSLRKESVPITATATLSDGQKLEITASVNDDSIQSNTIDRISSSIEENQDYYNQVDANNQNQPIRPEQLQPAKLQNVPIPKPSSANFTTTILHSSTVTKNGATLFPGSQVIKFTDSTGNVSIIPVSDPVSKHPHGSHHKPESNKIQMNNLLSFGSLGINSLSALKPVINAMAGLWQNNIKSNVRDKPELPHKPERPYLDKNPLMELNTNLKPPNRTPIYIPVGSVNDNEEAESQDVPEQYSDINQRNNPSHLALNKPAIEKPLMSGGIPISPGQVITANTDVIVGTPAVLGPRPPIKNSNEKSDVPIGMKPPPISISHYSDEEIDKSPAPGFSETFKIPPKPLSPAFLNNGFSNNFKFPPKNHYKYNDQKIPLPSEIKYSQLPLNTPLPHKDNVKEPSGLVSSVKLPHPVHVEHSSLNPLLVNVRPSQVAQVVIPHGSQTALIYSDEPSTYSTKGEIFNDPSPYPEENVNPGFVGLKVFGPVNTPQESVSKLASNTIHLDIPIDPYASDGALTESHHFIVLGSDGKPQAPYSIVNSVLKAPQNDSEFNTIFKRLNSKYNFTVPSNNVDFIRKPARPTWHQQSQPDSHHPGAEHNQRPFIFPQNHPVHANNNYQNHENNILVTDNENETNDNEEASLSEDDEITQETKLKPSSNQHSGEYRPNSNEHTNEHRPNSHQHSNEHRPNSHQHSNEHRPNSHQHSNEHTPNSHQNSNEFKTNSHQYSNEFKPNSHQNSNEIKQTSHQHSNEFNPNTHQQSNEFNTNSHQNSNEIKTNSYQHSNEFKPNSHANEFNSASATITVSGNDQVKEFDDTVHDHQINQNWEIMKEKNQASNVKPKPTQIPKGQHGDNSTTRENPNIKYSEWTSMEFPTYSNEGINSTTHSQLDTNSVANQEKETASNQNKKPTNHHRNNQDDMVIGLSPPPLPRPSVPPQKTSRPSLKPYEPKIPQRPSIKNKPKPTNPPYPFEKPTPTAVTNRPKTTINKPPPNILYETDAPHLAEEIVKLKPLNSTGRIEPVKKWQTTSKPTGLQPVYGNVVKVEPEKANDEKPTRSNSSYSDTIGSQSDKVVVVNKPDQENTDKATELISKWNDEGIISSSKNDFEDPEYKNTPTLITTNRTKAGSVSNTIFGNLYTRPPPANIVIIPTHSTTQHYTAISMVIDQEPVDKNTVTSQNVNMKPDIKPTSTMADGQTKQDGSEKKETVDKNTPVPTYYITHTKTLSVTITQTTVVQRDGQPSTHTVVLTKTQTSTLIDTVTKIQTLLQPTSVLSTITTTVPVTVSKEPTYSTTTATSEEPPIITGTNEHSDDNDSIFVVMTDKKSGTAHIAPAPTEARPTSFEVQVPDEANEISPNDILYSGIYTQHTDNECRPECKVNKNEICQKVDSNMRCICRPGFARMFPDHPCKPTYTYVMRLPLDRQGEEEIRYTDGLADRTSPSHQQLTEATRDGLDRMVMQSNLRDIYHGIVVSGFEPSKQSDKASVVYMVQLSENPEEIKLLEEVHRTLKANNYSLGGTDVFTAPDMFHFIKAEDFDECSDNKYHDCSEHAQCFNLRGTYTCSCKEGYTDMSYNNQFPGRICSADAIGCELCNYHGTCYYKANEDPTCECFQWYAGEFCQINLKVTLISLIAIGVLLSILLVVCVVMTCNKQKPPEILRTAPKPHVGFRRYRSVTNVPGDKRAIVSVDTSSEGSIERTPPPFIKQRVLRNEPPNAPSSHGGGGTVQSTDQRDRSLTVLIPRAKYRPVSSQPSSTLLTMSTFGPEQKLLNYAGSRESSRTPEKKMSRCSMHSRRLSNSTNLSVEPQPRKKLSAPRRPSSGALVSAGFEVSATVRRTQELDEAYISQSHNDLNQPTYNSIRTAESSIIVDVPPLPVFESSLEEFITRVDKLGTVSEARSYDETTIQPPVRSLHHVFHSQMHTCGSKNSSSQKTNLDEHHTMGERDLGSTYMPKSQLYKPDHRESDGSNFDSL